jgi:hypothetical protein
MPLPDLDPTRGPEQLFGDILDYVEKAHAMVAAREPLALAGLDTSIDALCNRILVLEPEVAKKYKDELEHLVSRIDDLQKNMIALQTEIANSLGSINVQKKASRAYNNAPTGQVEDE